MGSSMPWLAGVCHKQTRVFPLALVPPLSCFSCWSHQQEQVWGISGSCIVCGSSPPLNREPLRMAAFRVIFCFFHRSGTLQYPVSLVTRVAPCSKLKGAYSCRSQARPLGASWLMMPTVSVITPLMIDAQKPGRNLWRWQCRTLKSTQSSQHEAQGSAAYLQANKTAGMSASSLHPTSATFAALCCVLLKDSKVICTSLQTLYIAS
ncbi:hypothetical protein COO60DRAFT_91387 [Scenedesmus sp. NREL 46B-D3]|nr:hypothetical protein COO60DRAFT_91387 [Scenedesmus sp. NREL 46B-D3]